MAAIDPSYPLYPLACILASAMLFLVFLTSFIRQSWNLGVAFLCFWLFFENLTGGVNAIIWSDNADIKLYVYCDIVSHIQIITAVVKPMATLIITRRLYLITSLESVESNRVATYKGLAIEWTLGLFIPVLVAGPLYYVVQQYRFQVLEGFGCTDSPDGSILGILLVNSWNVVPSFFSVAVYYPYVARRFYRHSREINDFLRSDDSVTRTNYLRVLALASIDVLLTLPIGIASITIAVQGLLDEPGSVSFYGGWTSDHANWHPEGFSYADIASFGTFSLVQVYFVRWTSPVLAFTIFGLFGATQEARVSYWRIICTVCGWFGWKPTPPTRRARSPLAAIEFGERPAHGSMSLSLDSYPSFINPGARMQGQAEKDGSITSETESGAEKGEVEEIERPAAEDPTLLDAERPTYASGSHEAAFGNASAMV